MRDGSAPRSPATLVEQEFVERNRRHIDRYLREAKRLPGQTQTLDSFDFNAVPIILKAYVNALMWMDLLERHREHDHSRRRRRKSSALTPTFQG